MTDADIVRCVQVLDNRKKAGRPNKLASSEANLGKSSEDTAKTVGTSRVKVEKVRAVLDSNYHLYALFPAKKSTKRPASDAKYARKKLYFATISTGQGKSYFETVSIGTFIFPLYKRTVSGKII